MFFYYSCFCSLCSTFSEAAAIASVNKFYKNQPTQTRVTVNTDGVMLAENRLCTQNVCTITTDGESTYILVINFRILIFCLLIQFE